MKHSIQITYYHVAGHAGDLKTIRIDILHHASIERGINLPLTSKLIIGVLEYLYLLAAEM